MNEQGQGSKGFEVDGTIWQYDYQDGVWRFKDWIITYSEGEGYALVFPKGNRQKLRATSVLGAMLDAPWYIRRCNKKW